MNLTQVVTASIFFLHLFYASSQDSGTFVHYCGQASNLLQTPALRPYFGPMRMPREREGELVDVCQCMCDV